MSAPLGGMSESEFLQDYWQKKPLLIRQAFPGFVPELDSGDIAGLACEELADSRWVSGSFPAHDWALRYGPFEESLFSTLPETHWTLLVQDVEKHFPPLRRLLDRFSFLPRWRVDDLMASVAAPGGSVGPHVDQYDVFLLQAQGRRRGHIADSFQPDLLPDCELNVLKSFESEQEWVLETGDMLYLPPGIAHHGVALEECMTWSVGMRAPSSADLFLALGEWLAGEHAEGPRYSDPGLEPGFLPGELDQDARRRFQSLVNPASADAYSFDDFLGAFLSEYRLAHRPAPAAAPIGAIELEQALSNGRTLQQNPWTRLLWTGDSMAVTLFAAGMRYSCSRELACLVCDPERLASLDRALNSEEIAILCKLLNDGHLYLESEQ